MTEYRYRPDGAKPLPRGYFDQAKEACSIWGSGYLGMKYMGSTQSRHEQDGWRTITDYFVDRNGVWHTHYRYMKRGPDGEPVYVPSSVRIFGKYIKEWESEGKKKK